LEDETFAVYAPGATRLLRRLAARDPLPRGVYSALRRLAQYSAERRGVYVRVQNLKLDQRLERVLAFSGRGE
ncbi:MAG: hypothetical protein WAU52_10065, partial [Burkholderiales bacterium]